MLDPFVKNKHNFYFIFRLIWSHDLQKLKGESSLNKETRPMILT